MSRHPCCRCGGGGFTLYTGTSLRKYGDFSTQTTKYLLAAQSIVMKGEMTIGVIYGMYIQGDLRPVLCITGIGFSKLSPYQ